MQSRLEKNKANNQSNGTKNLVDMQIRLEKNYDALVLAIQALSSQVLEQKPTQELVQFPTISSQKSAARGHTEVTTDSASASTIQTASLSVESTDMVNSGCTQSINGVIAHPENKKKQKKKRKKKATSIVANVNNSVIDSTLLENQASRSTNVSDSVNPKKKVVVIAGDSMVQDIIGPKMNAKDSTHYFVVKSFSGATVSDMDDYVKPLIRRSPDKLILHIGTNDVKSSSPQKIADTTKNLVARVRES